VLTDPAKRKEYDETGGCSPRWLGRTPVRPLVAFNVGGDGAEFNLNDLFDAAGRSVATISATCSAACSDAAAQAPGPVGRDAATI